MIGQLAYPSIGNILLFFSMRVLIANAGEKSFDGCPVLWVFNAMNSAWRNDCPDA
jgi:hypothetical protein